MEIPESISYPFCGQNFELVIDTSLGRQHFTTDCKICCRPFELFVDCEPGEVLTVEVRGA